MNRKESTTCLAVLRDKDGYLHFAGDRRVSWGMGKAQITVRPKVNKRDGLLFAGTGVSYLCDIVAELMAIPKYVKDDDSFIYMHREFMPALVAELKSQGMLDKKVRKLNIEDYRSVILVGVASDLYEVEISDKGLSIDAIDAPYAHGCGGMYAYGSLLTTEKSDMSVEKRLKIAIQVAAKVSPGCDDNVDIVNNRPSK